MLGFGKGSILKQRRPSGRRNTALRQRLTLLTIGALSLVCMLTLIFRSSIWNRCANFLIAPDSPQKADIIFLLGGDYLLRAPYAAQLYKEGYAPKILIAREPVYVMRDRHTDFSEETIQLLENDGVPKDAIVSFSPSQGVKSTADEARALRIYADVYPLKIVLVVTSMIHSRRARMAIRTPYGGREFGLSWPALGHPRTLRISGHKPRRRW